MPTLWLAGTKHTQHSGDKYGVQAPDSKQWAILGFNCSSRERRALGSDQPWGSGQQWGGKHAKVQMQKHQPTGYRSQTVPEGGCLESLWVTMLTVYKRGNGGPGRRALHHCFVKHLLQAGSMLSHRDLTRAGRQMENVPLRHPGRAPGDRDGL